jgi:hypothetical protein
MDDITKKLLDHEASTMRDLMPEFEDATTLASQNTHATRAHLMRLGFVGDAFTEGMVAIASAAFGMMIGRLALDCRQSRHHINEYIQALTAHEFQPSSISDDIVARIGLASAQQLERLGRFAIGEVRACSIPGSDEWALISALADFLIASMPGGGQRPADA